MSLNLDYAAVHAFWYEFDKKVIYKIFCALESAETWAHKDEDFLNLLVEFGYALQQQSDIKFRDDGEIIKLLANINTPFALRIMQFLEISNPGYSTNLLNYAEENKDIPENNFFLERNLIFEKLQILTRIFAKERIRILLKAVGEMHDS